jgi:threonylcarbamoyladenosine tRNA methylthiotransferase MtaB
LSEQSSLAGNSRFTYAISTMGCKANLTDSQELETRLRRLGGRPVLESASPDLHLLNTCTVTDQADREARQILRKTGAKFTIATGCLAEVDPAQLEKAPAASATVRVVRNSAKQEIEALVEEWLKGALAEQRATVSGDRIAWHESILPNRDARESLAPSAEHRTRAFYKVQDGCNAFCSYCVIPLARGRSRSLPAAQVVSELRALHARGLKEVVLTAIHAADYESDGLDFTGLVEKVLRETEIPRLRLTSLDPGEIPDRLLELMETEPRLCPHFHVSLQAANSRVLAGMKRGYDADAVEERLTTIARKLPHAYVGMDLIAGFPGETDEEFADGLARLERLPWTKAHVFPFSVRRNTAAARLVLAGRGVPDREISDRARALRELSARKLSVALQSRVGSVMEVLTEEKEAKWEGRKVSQGHSRSYFKVLIPGKQTANELVRARIVGVAGAENLKGELI